MRSIILIAALFSFQVFAASASIDLSTNTSGSPIGAASGDLSGSYPAPTVTQAGAGTGAFVAGKVTSVSGVVLATSAAQPTCAVGIRGMLWLVRGASLAADDLEVCLKQADDSYAWESVTISPL